MMDIDRKALLEMADTNNTLPAYVAASLNLKYMCKVFLDYAQDRVGLCHHVQKSILFGACDGGHLGILKLALANPNRQSFPLCGADTRRRLFAKDQDGRTCLHIATKESSISYSDFLNINERKCNFFSPRSFKDC